MNVEQAKIWMKFMLSAYMSRVIIQPLLKVSKVGGMSVHSDSWFYSRIPEVKKEHTKEKRGALKQVHQHGCWNVYQMICDTICIVQNMSV